MLYSCIYLCIIDIQVSCYGYEGVDVVYLYIFMPVRG